MPQPSGKVSTFLKAFAIFSMATGTMDVITGSDSIGTLVEPITVNSTSMAFVDSQLRFLGAIWAGYGALLWWTSNDIETRRFPLGVLGAAMVAGGIGRTISGWKYGFSVGWVGLAALAEVAVPAGLYLSGV
jgi:hypothetical protein